MDVDLRGRGNDRFNDRVRRFVSAIAARREKSVYQDFQNRSKSASRILIDRYDVMSVLVASLLPPPFPFKLFVVSAGVFRLNLMRFTLAVAGGRTFRYLLLAYLAARYGDQAKELLTRYYPAIGITLAVLIVLFFVAKALMRQSE